MTRLWQKMNSRILALAWHPSKEAILAYGTYEGRVGNHTFKQWKFTRFCCLDWGSGYDKFIKISSFDVNVLQ